MFSRKRSSKETPFGYGSRAVIEAPNVNREQGGKVLIALALLLSGIGAWVPKVALPAAFLCFLALLSRPRHTRARWYAVLLGVAGVLSLFGVVRFVLEEAISGIRGGGNRAADKAVISHLRQLVVAEDAMRRRGFIDPDQDGVGSAGLLTELSGHSPLRGGGSLAVTPLYYRPEQRLETTAGSAFRVAGHLVLVCLPTEDGGYTAREGAAIDEERAEREFFAYAWPERADQGLRKAFSVDALERIWVSSNRKQGELSWVGPDRPPPCGSVAESPELWRPWLDKKPRESLPGDRG